MKTIDALLRESGLDRVDARLLMQHVLGVDRAWLIAHGSEAPSADALSRFVDLTARRHNGEPVAYLLGQREFYGRPFHVTPDVLIPRPETELLVEAALQCLEPNHPAKVLDVGTGSGCIAVTLALEAAAWDVWAVDVSAAALAVATDNAQRLGARLKAVQSDWLAALTSERFDLIVSNPPYIPAGDAHLGQGDLRFEPPGALTDFGDGLNAYRALAEQAPRHLMPDGWLLVEHGYDQGKTVPALLEAAGWREVALRYDYAGHPRVTLARRPD